MKIEKELERVDLFRIGEPRRRFGRSGRVHRAPPEARELGKVSGSGSPAIVAVWFAWWYLRPTLFMQVNRHWSATNADFLITVLTGVLTRSPPTLLLDDRRQVAHDTDL
ncbi:hypothetical protein [Micromonospora sp. LOL_024]|uniref:hypothetical protein n=1 Tax=Micromonospora sp. LOL_024 TaxID=3345412 RepID=UPI003A88FBCF